MNSTQFGGFARAILAWLGGFMLAKGWISAEYINDIVGLGSVIAVAVWSWYSNSTPAMIAAVAEAPEVTKIVTTPAMAMAIPSTKVVVR